MMGPTLTDLQNQQISDALKDSTDKQSINQNPKKNPSLFPNVPKPALTPINDPNSNSGTDTSSIA